MAKLYITMTIAPSGFIEIKRDQPKPKLDVMQAGVGGLIAPVDYACPRGVNAFVNDEGICLGMRRNRVAEQMTQYPGQLYGPCFIYFGQDNKRNREFMGV